MPEEASNNECHSRRSSVVARACQRISKRRGARQSLRCRGQHVANGSVVPTSCSAPTGDQTEVLAEFEGFPSPGRAAVIMNLLRHRELLQRTCLAVCRTRSTPKRGKHRHAHELMLSTTASSEPCHLVSATKRIYIQQNSLHATLTFDARTGRAVGTGNFTELQDASSARLSRPSRLCPPWPWSIEVAFKVKALKPLRRLLSFHLLPKRAGFRFLPIPRRDEDSAVPPTTLGCARAQARSLRPGPNSKKLSFGRGKCCQSRLISKDMRQLLNTARVIPTPISEKSPSSPLYIPAWGCR